MNRSEVHTSLKGSGKRPDSKADNPPVATLAEPPAESLAEPAVEPVAEPLAEPLAEVPADPLAEPAVEPLAEPPADPLAEPQASAGSAPVQDAAGAPDPSIAEVDRTAISYAGDVEPIAAETGNSDAGDIEVVAEQPHAGIIRIPDFSLIVLIGVSGSGKSTFAQRHFLSAEVLASDAFRALVSDDENDQASTDDAFDALHFVAGIRLRRRKLTVIDATNVQVSSRKPLIELARRHDCLAVAIVLDTPERVCQARNRTRVDRDFGPHVVRSQHRHLRQSLRGLRREGFRYVHVLKPEEIDELSLEREPLWTDRRTDPGPFDIIGDVHGCFAELTALLAKLGYTEGRSGWQHPEGRRAIFLGDLVDRGPGIVETVRLAQRMADAGAAYCLPGNHDMKLARAIKGNPVTVAHGLAASLEQIDLLPEPERERFRTDYLEWAEGLISHLWLDGGRLCVAHAGMRESYIGRASGRVREFALYGDTTGETDEFGLPVRLPWASEYRGRTAVVYGHTPSLEAEWLNNTINLDTGCVFGGKLTALRWPERELVQIDAAHTYVEPIRPLDATPGMDMTLQWRHDELLRAEDVLGRRSIETRLVHRVAIPAENAAAALEVMSRFAVEPRWLPYLPPTMSPCETTKEGPCLERPEEAFAYFVAQGIAEVVCERKHMGSRAVVIACRDEEAARRRFGATDGALGECVTRTGRRFFDDTRLHRAFLDEVRSAVSAAGLWEELETDWICLDCELMPWNAKAAGLLRDQYAPVASAASAALAAAIDSVEQAAGRRLEITEELGELLVSLRRRSQDASAFAAAYRAYCWPVGGLKDYRLAPFHLLATEGRTYFDRDHVWHMQTLNRLSDGSSLLMPTEWRLVQLDDGASRSDAVAWWQELTESGGEGMVVKPRAFVARGPANLVQPALKVRGREYLRIIYGPEYTEPANLERLRIRSLASKRGLALREFALGIEALERFVRMEPLRRVHECVFGILALESEPVDPRL
jgi:protein phosphatase